MLDRLALGLVSLPSATYDLILVLTDADGTRTESRRLLDRNILGLLVQALKPGATLKSQDGTFASVDGPERTEAILAGLNVTDQGATKAKASEGTVKLSFGKKANAAAGAKRTLEETKPAVPAGVGFVELGDDFGMDDFDDDYIPSKEELLADGQIDPDTLLTDADRQKPIIIREWSSGCVR